MRKGFKGQAEKNAVDKAIQSFAQTKLGGKLFITVFPWIDKRLMPLTKGRLLVGMGRPMRAHVAAGAERGELWALVNDHYNGYAKYQERAGAREIPIVVLEPR